MCKRQGNKSRNWEIKPNLETLDYYDLFLAAQRHCPKEVSTC